uniref:Putative bpti/kunitz family of serine protease inhibitor n=1 Tax=Amblyomma triste TaxID=251400 RepID=A0A023G3W0_AMBTT
MIRIQHCLILLLLCLAISQAQRSKKKVCHLPKVPGPCKASMLQWYFSWQKGFCLPFIYGGCRGNPNNFPTCASCMRKCTRKGDHSIKRICKKLQLQADKLGRPGTSPRKPPK